jgi:hypothetical protein
MSYFQPEIIAFYYGARETEKQVINHSKLQKNQRDTNHSAVRDGVYTASRTTKTRVEQTN